MPPHKLWTPKHVKIYESETLTSLLCSAAIPCWRSHIMLQQYSSIIMIINNFILVVNESEFEALWIVFPASNSVSNLLCFKVLNLFIALLLSSFNTDSPEGQEEPREGTKYQIAIAQIHKSMKAVKDRVWDHCCKRMRGSLRRTDKKKSLAEVSGKGIEVNYAMTDVRKYIDNSCFDIERCHMEESSSLAKKYEDILSSHSTCIPITAAEPYTDEGDDGHILHTAVQYRKQVRNIDIWKIIVTCVCKYNLKY